MRLLAIALLIIVGNVNAAPEVDKLDQDLYLLRGEFAPGRQPDGNSVLLRGKSGWIVVDTGRHAEHAQHILDFVKSSGEPIAAVVNSHWHLDHIGGNALLKRAYPDLRVHASMAIAAALDGFLAHYRKDLQTQIASADSATAKAAWQAEIAIIDTGKALYPDVPVTESATLMMIGRELQMNLAQRAVTDGDVWLYDRDTRALIAGDLVTLPVPFLDTACPAQWQRTLATLQKVPFRLLVPGHGAPMTRKDLKHYRHGFDQLLDCAASDRSIAQCSDDWIETLDELIPAKEQAFTRDLLEYYIGQVLRGDPKAITARCAG